MLFDVFKLGRCSKRRHVPIQVPQPLMQGRVAASDITDVAFEVLNVNRVEANNGRIETDVGFGDVFSKVIGIGIFCQVGLSLVQMFKKRMYSLFISFLSTVEKVSRS